MLFDCTLHEDWAIVFDTPRVPPVQFNFSVEGEFKHTFQKEDIQYLLTPLQGTITANTQGGQQEFMLPGGHPLRFTCTMIDRKQYLPKIESMLDKIPPKLAELFQDVKGKLPFFYQGNYSIASSECIQTIVHDQHQGLVRSTYLEGVCLKLLSCQFKQYEDDLSPPSRQVSLREQDVKLIIQAKNIMLENLRQPPTIAQLAKDVGLNQSKLKRGFKTVYNKPVKTWLKDKRLDQAKLLLVENSMNVGEVAQAVGFGNQSHFARSFRNKFGTRPKDFLKTLRLNLDNLLKETAAKTA